jgi:hypothetical protein
VEIPNKATLEQLTECAAKIVKPTFGLLLWLQIPPAKLRSTTKLDFNETDIR